MHTDSQPSTDPQREGDVPLWPEIEPYQTGRLQVSDLHNLYYELCGSESGVPVFVLHGGPGGGCSPYMRRFFDPTKFCIVLHDQRGSGKSTPLAEIKDNTTQHLVDDIEKLRKLLKLDKIILFGGSWGTTLALAYAEAYPDNVSGLVLRGVFLATQEETDHFYHGGLAAFFPDVYDKMLKSLPDPTIRPLPQYLLSLIDSDDPQERTKYSRLWAWYEMKTCGLEETDAEVEEKLAGMDCHSFSRIENHYMANGCFLREGQLLDELPKIAHIPTIMVNGRYDVICPPMYAFKVLQKHPKAQLIFAEKAGHWMGEKPVERELLKAMRQFEQ